MTEAERTRTRTTIRAMSIEQAEEGVSVSERNLIKVEALIAAKTQALGSISALDPRRRASMRRALVQELGRLSDHKAETKWFHDQYTQRVSGQEHNGQERKEPRSSAMTRANRALDNPDKYPVMTAEEVMACPRLRLRKSAVYEHPKLERAPTGCRAVQFTTKSVIALLESSPD